MPTLDVQLDVTDMTASVDFYTRLFGTPPEIIDEDRATFIKDDPAVRITIKQRGPHEHAPMAGLSVQAESRHFIFTARERLEATGMITEHGRSGCIYTNPDRLFVRDPDGNRWDFFRRPKLEDLEEARDRKPQPFFANASSEPFSALNKRLASHRPIPLRPEA